MEAKILYVRPSEVKIRELGVNSTPSPPLVKEQSKQINLDKVQIKKIQADHLRAKSCMMLLCMGNIRCKSSSGVYVTVCLI